MATSLANDLLRYLDQHFARLTGRNNSGYSFIKSLFVSNKEQEEATQQWCEALATLSWLPVVSTPLAAYMPWKCAEEDAPANNTEPATEPTLESKLVSA